MKTSKSKSTIPKLSLLSLISGLIIAFGWIVFIVYSNSFRSLYYSLDCVVSCSEPFSLYYIIVTGPLAIGSLLFTIGVTNRLTLRQRLLTILICTPLITYFLWILLAVVNIGANGL